MQYQGLVFQSRYRIRDNFSVNGHYTLQLKNDGNYEGEGTNAPGNKSFIGDYPEAFSAERNFPDGRLQDFQRSRLRLWSIYNWNLGAAGDVSVSGLCVSTRAGCSAWPRETSRSPRRRSR